MSDLTNLEIAWFDLGLSKGKQVERERIIKLLEGLIETRPYESNGDWRGYSLERIISIIKGRAEVSIISDDECPECGTTATYELGPNSFACKCTYEFETGEHK